MYRIGLPFWKQAAQLGVPLKLRIDVIHDDDAGVYVATSADLRGLVCEATSMDELVNEVNSSVCELLSLAMNARPVARPVTDLRLCAA